ncbi:MAG: restriction endonuclease subunit S [Anaerolineales bacterium]|nr:restriction endonuclease subunit S [Anaerolineales bacterium]
MSNSSTTVILNDLCEAIVDCLHKTAPTQPTGIPSIRTTDIKNGRLDLENANRVSAATYKEWTIRIEPQPGDIIMAREAPVGEVGIVPPNTKVVQGQRTVLIRTDETKLHSRYLLFLLLTPEMKQAMLSHSTGSTVAHLNMKDIRGLRILKPPPLPTQRRIAEILGRLDDKIETNRRINRTLEAMAQALYKHHFVDFGPYQDGPFVESALGLIPEGWEVGKLGDIATNIRDSIDPTTIEPTTPYIGLGDMPQNSLILELWGEAGESVSNKNLMRQGQILFGKLRPYFRKVGIVPIDGICSTDILVVEPKTQDFYGQVLCQLFDQEFVDYTSAVSSGTRMHRVNWNYG